MREPVGGSCGQCWPSLDPPSFNADFSVVLWLAVISNSAEESVRNSLGSFPGKMFLLFILF